MAYTNPRGQVIQADIGMTISALCACTLADYTGGGTTAPAVGDVVTFSATGDWYVKQAGGNQTKLLGRVTKVELAPTGTAVGYVVVEFLDVVGFRTITVTDLTTHTRGNSAKSTGSNPEDWTATAATGNLIVVAKSGTSGAGTVMCALIA